MADVQFDEHFDAGTRALPVRKKDWADKLVAAGYVKTRAQAQGVLLGVAAVCFLAAIFIAFSGGSRTPSPEEVQQMQLPGSF